MNYDPSNFTAKQWKKIQRERLLNQRQLRSQAESKKLSSAIQQHLSAHLSSHLSSHQPSHQAGEPSKAIISFYWPFKGEPDLRPFMKEVSEQGARIALPVVVEKNTPLQFMSWQIGEPLIKGVLNIPIPEKQTPTTPTVILAPAIGFDRQRYRLGYGGGYFDRTLATFSGLPEDQTPKVIGIAFSAGEIPTIHPEPHDIKMDVIITEMGIIAT